MKTKPVAGGYVIEFTPLSSVESEDTVIEGTVIAYEGWDTSLEIPSEVEIETAIQTSGKDGKEREIEYKAKIVVTGIGIAAFENYIYAEKAIIPNTVTSIGKYAFKQCSNLAYVQIPGSIKEIPDYCFINCENLSKVDFVSEGLKKIGDFSFSSCSMLPEMILPASCYAIGFSCFEKCKVLRNVIFPKEFNINKVDYLAFKESGFETKFRSLLDAKKENFRKI